MRFNELVARAWQWLVFNFITSSDMFYCVAALKKGAGKLPAPMLI